MSEHYILRDGRPVPEPDLMKWAQWMATADRIVEQTQLGDAKVSTVFLGLNHQFGAGGPSLLYETLVFGGTLDDKMERYATVEDAKAGHKKMVKRVKAVEAQSSGR